MLCRGEGGGVDVLLARHGRVEDERVRQALAQQPPQDGRDPATAGEFPSNYVR